MRRLCFVIWAVCAIAISAPVRAADSASAKKITSVEGITEYRLENGLKVLLFPDPSKPTVTVNLTIFVGSRHEGYGEAGMAHLLEHMLFKGTPTHPDVPKVLKERGARYNGTTWLDRTNYFETLPAGDENLEFAIRLEADRMMNSFVKAEDLASEMTVVRSEFERGENNPSSVLRQRMMSAAFQWHNYGQATIGNRADIERVPIEKLQVFYKKHYQPDNAMLVVAGSFQPPKALATIGKSFGAIGRPKRKRDTTYTEEPPQDGERVVTLRRVGDVAVVGAVYHIPSGAHPDYAAIDVLEGVLTVQPAGRLYKALVESKKASSVYGTAYALHDPGVLLFMAEAAQGNEPQAVLDTMLDVLRKVGDEGVGEDEVVRVKQRLLKQWELAADNSSRIAIQLSEWAAQGDWRLYFLYRDRLEKVTPQDVQRVAAGYLKRNNRTVGLFIPTKKPERVPIPATPKLAEMIGDYKGRKQVAAGEVFDVSPANIEARSKRLTLPGGVKVVLLPKKTRGESVNLRLTLRYGDENNLRGLATAAELLPSLMLRGTKKLTRQQFSDELDKYRARLNASGSAGEATFSIQTKREYLADALKLLGQVLREPTLPESELEIIRQANLSALEKQLTDPGALATTAVRRQLYPYEKGDPRYVPTAQEEIGMLKAVTPSQVRKLYESYLGAQAGELAVVGDFDAEGTLSLVTEMLDGWKATETYERLRYRGDVKLKANTQSILTPGKANARYFAATVFPLRDDDPDYPALVIGNDILGGGSLSSRLGDRVRQKEGLSYGVGSGLQARSLDKRAAFYIYAICNPANMDRLKAVIREELDRILKNGVTQKELETAKQGYLQRQNVARTNDARLTSILSGTAHAGRTMHYQADLEKKITELTREQVLAALRKHIRPKTIVIVAAGDFQK